MSWITLGTVGFILFCHWIADFILQTDEQARGKSTSNMHLFDHVWSYTAFMSLLLYSFATLVPRHCIHILNLMEFIGVTVVAHFCTDYVTSRLNKRLWDKGQVHNFFVSIGFDQLLHYAQLLITYKLLFT